MERLAHPRFDDGPSGRRRRVSPVGQERALAELLEDLTAAMQERGGVAIVGGEAGIGKTTLVRSLAGEAIQRGVRVLEAGCYDLHSTPAFGPWIDVFANLESDPALPSVPAAFAGGSSQRVADQAALFASVRDYFQDLTRTGTVMLVLEDLHWADPASLDLLRELGRRASRMPLLIVVTYRTDDLLRTNPFYQRLPALVRETDGRRVGLQRLDRYQLRTLVDTWMTLSPVDAARLVDYLWLNSDGNPFFATELIRALRDRGLLTRQSGQWELAALDQLVLPPLLLQVIDSRVSRLGDATREWLAVAAVIGQDVPLSIWSEVVGASGDDLLGVVERAMDAHVLEADDPGSNVRFVHALTRNALYESVLPPRRREWHRSIARTLMATSQPDPDTVAHHLQMAGEPDAWRWLVKAAERARNAYAWASATERYRAAVEQLRIAGSADPITEGKLLYTLAFLQRFSAPREAAEVVQQVRRLPGLAQDPIRNAESLWVLSTLLCYSNCFRAGLAQYEAMVELLQPLIDDTSHENSPIQHFIGGEVFSLRPGAIYAGDPLPRIPVEMTLAELIAAHLELVVWLQAAAGSIEPARIRMDRPPDVPAAGDEHRVVFEYSASWVWLGEGIGAAALGMPAQARTHFSNARSGFRQIAHFALESQAILVESADVAVTYGLADPAYRRLLAAEGEAALRRAGGALRSGLSPRIAWLRCLVLDGRWAEAMDILDDSPPPGNAFLWRNLRWSAATLARFRGEPQLAWEQIRQVFPLEADIEPGDVIFHEALELQILAADLCLDAGELDRAREWLTMHDRWLEWSGTVLGVADGELGWARLMLAEASGALAAARAASALREATDPDLPGVRLGAHRVRAEVALRTGRLDEAVSEASKAIELAELCALPYERGLTQVLLAKAHLAAGTRSEANLLVNEAIATFTLLEAEPALRQAVALLTRLEPNAPIAERGSDLSERELAVLRLIVAGRSNQAIADELFISWTTARTHVSHIFRKLGVSSRAEAVDVAHRRGLVLPPDR
jgi:DNA-binding CsgD family transcriptional regulator